MTTPPPATPVVTPKEEPGFIKSTGNLLTDTLNSVSSLIRNEIDLARAEVDQNVKRAGRAIGMLVAAGVIGLVALNVLAAALVDAIAAFGLAVGWAALIVGAILGIIAYILMNKGTSDLKLSSLAPTRTAKNVRRDANAVKETYNDK
nr:phage holin family protein [Oceaniovalibus guishaninsula]